jgi:predicted ABC-type ATPase
MALAKRLRIFAGPNGSGKTTIIEGLRIGRPELLGIYVNADDIEHDIASKDGLPLDNYQINFSLEKLQSFFKEKAFSPEKLLNKSIANNFNLKDNSLYLSDISINSYIAADIAEFIRQELLKAGKSFTYETVMSHKNKLAFMKLAKEEGYRVYLYFVATEDPDINVNRVKIRVAQQGHGVAPEVIRSRYYRSLENLKDAVKITDRAYIFDSSGEVNRLIAEVTNGVHVEVIDEESVPNWFVKYLVE